MSSTELTIEGFYFSFDLFIYHKMSEEQDLLNELVVKNHQNIFSCTGFMNELKKDHTDISSVLVFFFHEKIKSYTENGWNNYHKKMVFFHPVAVVIQHPKSLQAVSVDDLKTKYGDDFGLKFSCNRFLSLSKLHKVNMIEIDGKETTYKASDGELHKYYQSKTAMLKKYERLMNRLVEKYYETAPTFTFRPKNIIAKDEADDSNNNENALTESQLSEIMDAL